MISTGFIDLLLFALLLALTIKGWVTGFIRSVVTILAFLGGWLLSGMAPELTGGIIAYSVPYNSPYHAVAARIFTFILCYAAVQLGGFALTGLIENIKLGTLDKFIGLLLGAASGVMVGCFVVSIFFTHPKAYWAEGGRLYMKKSAFFKAYTPMVKKFVKVPHRPAEDS